MRASNYFEIFYKIGYMTFKILVNNGCCHHLLVKQFVQNTYTRPHFKL